MSFKIITDSTVNLSPDYINKHDISVVNLFYLFDGVQHPAYDPERPNHYKEFYDTMRTRPKVSTSCANQNQYFEEFEKAVKCGLTVLYVGFSVGVSASYTCAENAKEQILKTYPNAQIYSIDTLTGSLGQGHFVKKAVEMRKSGISAKEVYEFIKRERMNLNTYVTVDDLFFLKQGGRISSLSYGLGKLIQIKPIIKVSDEGKLVAVSKVVTRKQSLNAMFNVVKERIVSPETSTIYISHGDCVDVADSLAKRFKEELGVKEVIIDFLEPVIGSHTGAGSIALFFFANGR